MQQSGARPPHDHLFWTNSRASPLAREERIQDGRNGDPTLLFSTAQSLLNVSACCVCGVSHVLGVSGGFNFSLHTELCARQCSSTTKQEWFDLLLCQIIASV